MLSVRGITKTFPVRKALHSAHVQALQGIDLEVSQGSFTAILGTSGCGKTTLLRVIAGFERPDSGEVHLNGVQVSGPGAYIPSERRGIGIVPQEGALFPHLSVAGNIAFGLSSRKQRRTGHTTARASTRRRERTAELLELIGLVGYGDRSPAELSGGQQQRVALARALAPDPALVLLDEPFAALDAGLRTELREQVRDVLARVGATAVLVTHDQEEALSLADQVAVMRQGRIVRSGLPRDVYLSPGDSETAAFLGDVVSLPGRLLTSADPSAAYAECALGCLAVGARAAGAACPGGQCTVMLRPEQIKLSDSGVAARVVGATYYGHDALVQLRLGSDGSGAALLLRTHGHSLPEIGSTVAVGVDETATAYVGDAA